MILVDFVDKVNFKFTVILLVGCAAIIGLRQNIGDQVKCWTPSTFTDAMTEYVKSQCWSNPTFYHVGEVIRPTRGLSGYQFFPVMLLLLAAGACTPLFLWQGALSLQKGLDINGIVSKARQLDTLPKNNDSLISQLADQFHARLIASNLPAITNACYLFVKTFSVILSLAQLALLRDMTGGPLFGLEAMVALLYGNEIPDAQMFPRTSMCDYEVRVMGNIQRHTTQCVFRTNQLVIPVLVFFWLWFAWLLVANIFSLLYWLIASVSNSSRVAFAFRLASPHFGKGMVQSFTVHVLGVDGVFCLRLIENLAGHQIADRLINHMLVKYTLSGGSNQIVRMTDQNHLFGDFNKIATIKEMPLNDSVEPFENNFPSLENNPETTKMTSVYPSAPLVNDLGLDH